MPLRIQQNFDRSRLERVLLSAAICAMTALSSACSHVNDPFRDSSASIDSEMTTASADGYKDKSEFSARIQRRGATSTAYYENGATTHWPLWFEDPFEDKGNDVTDPNDPDAPDNHFAWNWVDYLHGAYGPGRAFFVNAALWPISAIVTLPGSLMESDGRISQGILFHDHDAKRSDSASREPPDGNHLGVDENATTAEPTTTAETKSTSGPTE